MEKSPRADRTIIVWWTDLGWHLGEKDNHAAIDGRYRYICYKDGTDCGLEFASSWTNTS